MDTNGTQFHLLFGRDNWAGCTGNDGKKLGDHWDAQPVELTDAFWDATRGDLTLRPQAFRFVASRGDNAPTPEDRRGAARDRYGNWYWISEDKASIQVRSSGSDAVTVFWPISQPTGTKPTNGDFHDVASAMPAASCTFSGLTVTEDHFLVVGALDVDGSTPRLLIFDLHAGGAPQTLLWPASVSFSPFDFAPRAGGGLWILDRIHHRLWGLNRYFQILRAPLAVPPPPPVEDFTCADLSPPATIEPTAVSTGFTIDDAALLPETDPISIECLPDGSVLILDRPSETQHSLVSRYRDFQRLGSPVSLGTLASVIKTPDGSAFIAVGHDFAYAPTAQRLFLVTNDGNQAFAFDYTGPDDTAFALVPAPSYFPMRLFSGKALVFGGGDTYYDYGDRWLPLVEQMRPRFVAGAEITTYPLDSDKPDCIWHRVMLDATLPAETALEVSSRAADDPASLLLLPWQPEPSPYLRGGGNELPFLPGATLRPTRELLLQQARGRFLQLQLRLIGNGRASPRVRALRAYYPRFSYLSHYMPAFYREDPDSASFLERFLANVEGILTSTEDRIAAAQLIFDPAIAPPDWLPWLATWFGVAIDESWTPQRQRLFLRNAMTFFQWRGTAHGLRAALRLVFDTCLDDTLFTDLRATTPATRRFRIVEAFRSRRGPGVLVGDASNGPQQIVAVTRWQPAQGADTLHQRYRAALATSDSSVLFPILPPANAAAEAAWETFCTQTLGFIPAIGSASDDTWTAFLRRRYLSPAQLPSAYGTSVGDFTAVPRPITLPAQADALTDWFLFESVVLATRASAHTFRVLLPVSPTASQDASLRLRQLQLASRIIELEKPAHTLFDVRFYWALFRLGEARLGEDTQIGAGSRAPELLPPLVIGETALAENFLAPAHPYDVPHRFVIGRDTLSRRNPLLTPPHYE
jgi:phage tail-like protein